MFESQNSPTEDTDSNSTNLQEPLIIYLDLSKHDSVTEAINQLAQNECESRVVDILINCGGVSQRGSVLVGGDQIKT